MGAPRGQKPQELGFTLVEMSVAMLIMSVFMALIVGGMVHLLNPTMQVEAMSGSSDQLDVAFLDMDSQVRYASQIWAPYQGTAGNWDLLFVSTFNGSATPTCTELRYEPSPTGELVEASWAQGTTSPSPSFKELAGNLVGTADPFQEIDSSPPLKQNTFTEQQLEVTLYATSGSGQARETSESQVTFTALNSTVNTYSSQTTSNCYNTIWADT